MVIAYSVEFRWLSQTVPTLVAAVVPTIAICVAGTDVNLVTSQSHNTRHDKHVRRFYFAFRLPYKRRLRWHIQIDLVVTWDIFFSFVCLFSICSGFFSYYWVLNFSLPRFSMCVPYFVTRNGFCFSTDASLALKLVCIPFKLWLQLYGTFFKKYIYCK